MGPATPRLVLVGQRGWENEMVLDVLERSELLRDHIAEHNALPDKQVRSLIAGARAVLLPSFAEGYGLPIAEALALGTPVLCSDLPALREAGGAAPGIPRPAGRPGLDGGDPATTSTRALRTAGRPAGPHRHLVPPELGRAYRCRDGADRADGPARLMRYTGPMPADAPFWKTVPLDEMTSAQWESLCDGCGRCCLHKLRDEDTGELAFTNVSCRLLDTQSCRCSRYETRRRWVPDCVSLTPAELRTIDWLPPTCGYRLVAEGRDLPWWHPLVSGTRGHGARDPGVRARPGAGRAAGRAAGGSRRGLARPGSARRNTEEDGAMTTDWAMKDALYGGVNAAVLTAMRPDLSIDLDLMAAHCRWLLANGCNGLGVLGTTGEANSLGVSERIALMEGLAERGIPAAKMLPGCGLPAIPDTVLMARRAGELGARGVLVLPPFFYKNPSEDGLFAYYSEVAQRIGGAVQIYFYHFPAQSAVPVTVPLIERLLRALSRRLPRHQGQHGDWANTKAYIDAFARDGFEVYCGDDGHLHQVLQAGGAGSISAASNVSCAQNARVYAGWDQAAGAEAQDRAVRHARGRDLCGADPRA